MADNKPDKNKVPLLAEELTPTERVSLAGLKQHPGYAVLEKILAAACKRATEDAIKVDPQDDRYEQKLKALHQKARERNEFSLLVLMSIEWHTHMGQPGLGEEQKSEQEANRIVKGLK